MAMWILLALSTAMLAVTVRHAIRPRFRTMWLSLAGLAAVVLGGVLGTVLALRHSFGAVAEANPAEKATRLASGISSAMNLTAVAVIATALWVAPFLIGELRRRRRRPTASSPAGGRPAASP